MHRGTALGKVSPWSSTRGFCCPAAIPTPTAELVFVDLLRRPGIDSQLGGPVRNPIYRTGPPGYIGWRNRFLGIDSWAAYTFTNTGSVLDRQAPDGGGGGGAAL
jgi:hypothetical protein